ncbi:hypothetical protein HZS_3103 [Henneguya salminicola]|nr:hypothetical protein HZS_3103 [Henneguya salminicola]
MDAKNNHNSLLNSISLHILELFSKHVTEKITQTHWNLSQINELEVENRTKKVLIEYNQRLDERFSNVHQNLCPSITDIGKAFQFYGVVFLDI